METIRKVSVGDKFSNYTVIEPKNNETNRNKRIFKCSCSICGNEIELTLRQLIRKSSANYSCMVRLSTKKWGTPEYNSYRNMKTRCHDPKHRSFKWYGGKGIKISDRWLGCMGFENFLTDMGYKPTPKHQIDRIDSDKNYGPDNCKWSTHLEQQLNKKKL